MVLTTAILCLLVSTPAEANKKYASLVMDADTGAILHQRYADKMLHPASLTKVMTLLMVFEALDSGELKLNDRIYISRKAASMVPSKLDLPPGSSIRVKDAIYALVTKSANDVAVALAEKLGKTESRFAMLMTQKARSLGMNRTRFMNASGLHHPKQVTTARDMAKMGRYLIALQPRYYRYFSTQNFKYRGKSYRNHNRLLGQYDGMDGIKTGYIQASGFNLLASAKRGDKRLIGVVFGGRTSKSRNAHMREIMDAGFREAKVTRSAKIILPTKNPRRIALAASNASQQIKSGLTTKELNTSQLTESLLSAEDTSKFQEARIDKYKDDRIEVAQLTAQKHMQTVNTSETPSSSIMAQKFLKPKSLDTNSMGGFQNASMTTDNWGIQVGAYANKNTANKVLDQAYKKLPTVLQYANMQLAPLQGSRGTIYRAWLKGFSQKDAQSACTYFNDCLVLGPKAN